MGCSRCRNLGRPSRDQGQLASSGQVGPSENVPGHQRLARRGVRGGEPPDDVHAVRAAGHVDGASPAGFPATSGGEDQLLQGLVMGQHGDDQFPVRGRFRHGAGRGSAGGAQFLQQRRYSIVHRQVVAAAQNARRHAVPHAPEADESDFHNRSPSIVRAAGRRPLSSAAGGSASAADGEAGIRAGSTFTTVLDLRGRISRQSFAGRKMIVYHSPASRMARVYVGNGFPENRTASREPPGNDTLGISQAAQNRGNRCTR